MNRIFEIVNNTFIIKKQKLEQELEETLNQKGTCVETRVDKIKELVLQISAQIAAKEVFNSYINKNTDGTN